MCEKEALNKHSEEEELTGEMLANFLFTLLDSAIPKKKKMPFSNVSALVC